MPLYEYECSGCRSQKTLFRPLDNRDKYVSCHCGRPMHRIISQINLPPDRFPYVHSNLAPNPVTIRDRKQEKHEFASRKLVDAR